jgi:hypothetical protein
MVAEYLLRIPSWCVQVVDHPPGLYRLASAFSLTLDHIALGYNIQLTTMSTSSISAFSLLVSFIISDLTILCVSNEIEKTNCIKN